MQVYNAFYVDKPFSYNQLRTMLFRFLQVEVSGSFRLPSYSNSVSLASAISRCFHSSRWNASACEDLGGASPSKRKSRRAKAVCAPDVCDIFPFILPSLGGIRGANSRWLAGRW